MSYKTESNNTPRKSNSTKPGRTLLIKPTGTVDLNLLDKLEGMQTKYLTEKSKSYFLTFATAEQSLNALKLVKKQFGTMCKVKFAHYRVYFTITGLLNETDYGVVKTRHTEMVQAQAGCNVLYYRLYRKNNCYLGCGDMTVDTKEGFDRMMDQDVFKNFSLDNQLSGVHYRYNKTKADEQNDTTQDYNCSGNVCALK